MYVPQPFRVEDPDVLAAFVRRHDFATLVTTPGGEPSASHVPLLLEEAASAAEGVQSWQLHGHLARANPQWQALREGSGEALAIFHGPHGYVSPSWYEAAPAVPTWNYAAVHVYGEPSLVEDAGELDALLDAMVSRYEALLETPWSGDLPAKFRAGLRRGIVGFRLRVTRVEGKFKLGQNRPAADQRGTVAALAASDDPVARALAALTTEHLGLTAPEPRAARRTGSR